MYTWRQQLLSPECQGSYYWKYGGRRSLIVTAEKKKKKKKKPPQTFPSQASVLSLSWQRVHEGKKLSYLEYATVPA